MDSRIEPTTIAPACREAIEQHRDAAERDRRLPPPLVEQLRDARAFALLTPVEWGGLELGLTESSAVYEALGRIDGPTAWNVWNGNAGFSAAMLEQDAADAIWGGPADPIVANSARPVGVATPVDGGFRLSGRWDIVSAVEIADWVILFGIVAAADAPPDADAEAEVDGPAGMPDIRAFYVPREDVTILDTWDTAGMRATGSHSVVADAVLVDARFAISPFAPARIDRPLFRIPAFTLASTGGASILVGMAQAALDELATLARTKSTGSDGMLADRPRLVATLGASQTSLDAARALLALASAAIDAAAEAGQPIDVPLRATLRAAMSHAATTSRSVLVACYEQASSTALLHGHPIERIVRDGLVAAQHAAFGPALLDARGRVLVGRDPAEPVL